MVGLNGSGAWLGALRDSGSRDNFVWSDGTPWNYTNWAETQPDDYKGHEDCAQIWEFYGEQWNDRPCSDLRFFVCKKEATEARNIDRPHLRVRTSLDSVQTFAEVN